MKKVKIGFGKKALIHASIGGLIGYLILHPASMFIKDIAEHPYLIHWDCFRQSFSLIHLPMAIFFVILGAVFGIIIAFHVQKIVNNTKRMQILEGLLPICANCKRIRDGKGTENEKGKWVPVELYISERSEAEFSHSICPDCMKKLYPEFATGENSSVI